MLTWTPRRVNELQEDSKYQTAIHEAGHAVMSIMVRRGIKYVALTLGHNKHAGICVNRSVQWHPDYREYPECSPRFGWVAEREIMVLVAGHIALEIATRGTCGSWEEAGGEQDCCKAVDYALKVSGSGEEAGAFIDKLWQSSRTILMRPDTMAMVKAVAAELMIENRLSGKRVREICQSKRGADKKKKY